MAPGEITEELFRRYLYATETPDPDLIILDLGRDAIE